MQESGRDGSPSIAYLAYQSYQLFHVEQIIKLYLKTGECRGKYLLQFFDMHFGAKPLSTYAVIIAPLFELWLSQRKFCQAF